MIAIDEIKYTVVLIDEKKEAVVLNNFLTSFSWEEMNGQLASKASLNLLNAQVPGGYLTTIIKLGTYIKIFAEWCGEQKEVFSGRVWTWTYNSAQNKDFKVVAYDHLIYIQKSKDAFYFPAGKKTSEIIKEVCGDKGFGVPVEYLGSDETHEKEKSLSQPAGEFILNILDNAYKKGAPKCVIRWENDKMRIIPKGDNTEVYVFEADTNTFETNHSVTLDNLVTRVIVRGREKDDKVGELVIDPIDGKTEFGIIQELYLRPQDATVEDAKKAAEEIMKERGEPQDEMSVECADLPILRKGHKVKIAAGSIVGHYYVKGVVHNGSEKTMTMEVEKI